MDKKIFVTLVKKEAKKLRNLCTKVEKNKLDFYNLAPQRKRSCIYGQLTGNCFSRRANNLIVECCERIIIGKLNTKRFHINGKPKPYSGIKRIGNWSPIEAFIMYRKNTNNGNNKMLVSYLKGETKTLSFKPF